MEKCCMPVVKFYLAKIYSQWRNTMWTSSIRKVSEVLDWGESFHNQTVHMFTQFGYIWEFVKHSPNTRLWHYLNVETCGNRHMISPQLVLCFTCGCVFFWKGVISICHGRHVHQRYLEKSLEMPFDSIKLCCSSFCVAAIHYRLDPVTVAKKWFRLGFPILYMYNHPGADSHLRRLKSTTSRFLVGILRVPEPPTIDFAEGYEAH